MSEKKQTEKYPWATDKEVNFVGQVSDEEFEKLQHKHGFVYTIYIPVNDEGTEVAVGYLKKIDRELMGAALSMKDPIRSKEMVLNSTFIEGDKRILDDDDVFFSACMEVDKMMTFRKGMLKKN